MGTNSPFGAYAKLTTSPSGGMAIQLPDGSSGSILADSVVTVGAHGQFTTIAAALNWIGSQTCFVARTDLGSPVATAWTQGTSTITLSTAPTSANYDPSTRMWFKIAGDTYYYPVDSSSGFGVGSGTLYSAMNRIEASLTGTPSVTFYEEQNYTILILDPWFKEVVTMTSLAPAMSATITSLNGAVLDINTSGASTWMNGRLKFHNVVLHHNGQATFGTANSFNTLKLEMFNTQIDAAQADFYSPVSYFGAVDMEFCRINSFYNSTRGHMLNFLTKGDQRFKNITWNVKNNAAIAAPSLSNAFFMDRFYARNIFLENIRGNLADPHGDFGYATIVGSGNATTGIGNAAYADYISIQDCNLVMRDAATATMKLNILSLADGTGMNLGATTAGASGGIVDIHNCGVIAPRGTSTRKLVEAVANPTNAITVNYGVNPFAQAKDAQANITYTAIS